MTESFQRTEAGYEFVDVHEVLTPVETEVFLKRLNNELARATLAVIRSRDAEVDTEEAYSIARQPWLHDEDCPEVGRRAGQVTQRQADLWFAERIPDEYRKLRRAQVARRNAIDYSRQVRDQIEVMRSITATVRAIYDNYRGGGR